MLLTSIIAVLMVALLLYGHVPTAVLGAACAVAVTAAVAAYVRRCRGGGHHHHHHDLLGLDTIAHDSRLAHWNAGLKTCLCLALVVACVAADSLFVAAVLFVGMSAVSLWSSRVGLARYCGLIAVPVLFVALSGIVLLVDVSNAPGGLLAVPVAGWYLCVTPESQAQALVVIARAVGSLSCLYALALSTPVYEVAGFLRAVHVPAIVVDLMLLVYRYVSVLVGSLRQMTTAAQARLGENSYRAMWRSFSGIGANLFVRSFFRAGRSFDAMEARGYADELRFDVKEHPMTLVQAAAVAVCLVCVAVALLCEKVWL